MSMAKNTLKNQKKNPARISSSPFLTLTNSQDFVDVLEISNGLVFLRDGSVVKILELVPINYSEKADAEKDYIADIFGYSFKSFPVTGQIKVMDSKANLDSFVAKLIAASKDESNESYAQRLNDYIANTKRLQKYNSTKKRFFFIFSYEGDSRGKKSTLVDEIYTEMKMQTALIASAFMQIGNIVINADDDNDYVAEILYSFFNPKSFETEGLTRRIEAVNAYKHHKNIRINTTTKDYISPRGISFKPYEYMLMDGIYHTYLSLRDNSFPFRCNSEWVRTFLDVLPDCDIDIHFKKLPQETYTFLLDRQATIRGGVAIRQEGDDRRQKESIEAANNSRYLYDLITKHDEDLYEVSLMITLKSTSLKDLRTKRDLFIKKMKNYSFYFESCFLLTNEFFKMAMPLNYIVPSVFNQNKRNMTNSSLASLYCITSYEMFEPDGFCMGILGNDSLFSFNNFNTKVYPNAHIFIAGTTGAGKTYTEMMLASRMRLSGIRTVFLLPLKGHEYKDMVKSLGGSYIPLMPGGKACINIMEIREEALTYINDSLDEEETEVVGASLLAKKITSILTFLTILSGEKLPYDVEGLLNVALTDIYARFGITNDNESIWEDKRNHILKKMPILSDLLSAIEDVPELKKISALLNSWVNGNCKNMNGQTNVNLDNKMIAFDIDEDKIGERFLPAFMYIAFDMAYSIAKKDLSEKCALVLDEIWKMLTPSCGNQIFKCIKIIRAYNTCCITATQDIEDCTENQYGRSIITLSATQILLKATKKEIDELTKVVDLSESDKRTLMSMNRGEGYMCFNTERIKVHFISSILEEELYSPDPIRKRELRIKRLSTANM